MVQARVAIGHATPPLLSLAAALLLFIIVSDTERYEPEVLASASSREPATSGLVDLEQFARRQTDAREAQTPQARSRGVPSLFSQLRGSY